MNSENKFVPLETDTNKEFEIRIEENGLDLNSDDRKDWRTAKDVV
jgi:hypothetical protein